MNSRTLVFGDKSLNHLRDEKFDHDIDINAVAGRIITIYIPASNFTDLATWINNQSQ